ncbi:unnamed protein product [Periconia digitata]|uniref:Uncharacterized protein n=1 Tax=Periconia digitata TaxID=1303443 RepID=A0A9W4XQ56_9PLEO|nr:unnamed protein product [Periconia digitata]
MDTIYMRKRSFPSISYVRATPPPFSLCRRAQTLVPRSSLRNYPALMKSVSIPTSGSTLLSRHHVT